MKRKQGIQMLVFLMVAVIALVCTAASQDAVYTSHIPGALGTDSQITITTARNGNAILRKCGEYMKTMDHLFSVDSADGDIAGINRAAGTGTAIPVSEDTVRVLTRAKNYAVETNGFFDVTVGALVDLWERADAEKTLPGPDEIAEAIRTIDYCGLQIDPQTNSVYLEKPGQQLDLGGIAKGYVTDELVNLLRQNGVHSALINLGGNTYALGKKNAGSNWRIGIQDPRDADKLLGSVEAENQCVITSGDYQRYFELDGVRYHHILNPNTGAPSRSGLKSVTIVAKDATLADALSTACFVLGYSTGANLVKEYDDVSAIFVLDSNTVYYSAELEGSFVHDNPTYEYKIID